jgi:hypothetical protein
MSIASYYMIEDNNYKMNGTINETSEKRNEDLSEVEEMNEVNLENLQLTEKELNEFEEKNNFQLNETEENIPDIKLGPVRELPTFLKGFTFEDIRKGLFYRYGLLVHEEKSISNLYMICYEKSEKVSKKTKKVILTEEERDLVNQYRGVIVEKETNKVMCYTFDKMNRHLPEDWNLEDCEIMESKDGSQIKCFYDEKSKFWVISTTRKIDASKSYFFSNKSFFELFNESAFHLNWERLNKECCYSFVMSHPENRVVTKYKKPYLLHVLTRNMKTFELVKDDIGIPRPESLKFLNKQQLFYSIKKLPSYKEGYVIRKGDTFVKVINKSYQFVKNLRGSSTSLLYHFFDLEQKKKTNLFLKYYPEFSETFKYFNACFHNLVTLAYNEYVLLRVRKNIEPPQILPFLKPVLYRIHGIHLNKKMRVRMQDVKNHLSLYPPHVLRRLVDSANSLPYSFI